MPNIFFFFFFLPSCISQFALHVINRIILFVRLVIHPQNPLKVFCSIDLNVIPNISHPCRDSSRRAALAESLVRQKRALKFALIRGQRELVLKTPREGTLCDLNQAKTRHCEYINAAPAGINMSSDPRFVGNRSISLTSPSSCAQFFSNLCTLFFVK